MPLVSRLGNCAKMGLNHKTEYIRTARCYRRCNVVANALSGAIQGTD